VTRWLQLLLLVLTVGLVGFGMGRKEGARTLRLEQLELAKKKTADSIRVADKLRELTKREAELALREATLARATYRSARSRVKVVSDSSVSVDGAPPTFVGIPVVSTLRSGEALARRDSVAMEKLKADVAACGQQNQLKDTRIKQLEEENSLIKPSRCGFKCGVGSTLGVLGLLALLL
jgi:hypothetical protein